MSNYVPIKFPGARYGPGGAAGVFNSEAEVPKGWTDNPNDFLPDALDHDGDGKKGGSPDPLASPKERLKSLRAQYEALFGKKPFMGWDEVTLLEKLA